LLAKRGLMPTHSAKSLFSKNIQSAKDSLGLYDAIVRLNPQDVDIDWVLRSAVVFTVSALDTYFHDKVKYRVGRYSLENLPPGLSRFEIPIRELSKWDKARRKGNVLRNWVVEYLATKPLQSPNSISDALKLVGIESLWSTIEPNKRDRDGILKELNEMIKRRNQISHEGDRMSSRRSGKRLRAIDREQVVSWIEFTEDLVRKIENAFPA
jgi:hypothetical protein